MSAVSISVFSICQAVCENVYQFLITMVFVDGNSMSVVQHWIGKRSMLVRKACL